MIVQLAPAPSVALPHVPDFVYFAGAAGYDMSVAAAIPLLVTVMDCAALVWPTVTLPNERKLADEFTLGEAVADPVPESAIDLLVPPLPVTAMLPAYAWEAAGENVTVIVQLPPT